MRKPFRTMLSLGAIGPSVAAPAGAQGVGVAVGSEVYLDGHAMDLRGVVVRQTADSIYVRPLWADHPIPLTRGDTLDVTVRARMGTRAASGAKIVGLVSGAAGFWLGYCLRIFGEGCARDMDQAADWAVVYGTVGALAGGLLGLMLPAYVHVEPEGWFANGDLGSLEQAWSDDWIGIRLAVSMPAPQWR